MDRSLIYWASAGQFDSLRQSLTEQAEILTKAGEPVSWRESASFILFCSESLDEIILSIGSSYGHYSLEKEDSLGVTLLIGASLRYPMSILISNSRGELLQIKEKRKFLEQALSHLEEQKRDRIIMATGLLDGAEMLRYASQSQLPNRLTIAF